MLTNKQIEEICTTVLLNLVEYKQYVQDVKVFKKLLKEISNDILTDKEREFVKEFPNMVIKQNYIRLDYIITELNPYFKKHRNYEIEKYQYYPYVYRKYLDLFTDFTEEENFIILFNNNHTITINDIIFLEKVLNKDKFNSFLDYIIKITSKKNNIINKINYLLSFLNKVNDVNELKNLYPELYNII